MKSSPGISLVFNYITKIKIVVISRAVTKISSCWVRTTSRQGIKQLGISFASIFLLFSYESSQRQCLGQPGEIPGPRLLMTALDTLYFGCNLVLQRHSIMLLTVYFSNYFTIKTSCQPKTQQMNTNHIQLYGAFHSTKILVQNLEKFRTPNGTLTTFQLCRPQTQATVCLGRYL